MFITKITLRSSRLGKKLKSPPPPPLALEDHNNKSTEYNKTRYNNNNNNNNNKNKKQQDIISHNTHTPTTPSKPSSASTSISSPRPSFTQTPHPHSSVFKSLISRSMSFLRISTHRTTTPMTIVSEDYKKSPSIAKETKQNKEMQLKISAFLKLLGSHSEFFKGCPEIDTYLIAMAFVHLQRVQPPLSSDQYNSELLFYALYLAWETEEDSTAGVEGIIHYVIGPFPSGRNKDKITRKYEIVEWKRKLQVFHVGKDKLWKALDYRTMVDRPTTLKALNLLPQDQIKFVHPRAPKDLAKFFS